MREVIFALFLAAAVLLGGCIYPSPYSPENTLPPQTTSAPVTTAQLISIPYGEEYKTSLDVPATEEVYLFMIARIDSSSLQGGRPFLKIMVNGKEVTGERLVNKANNLTYGNGRVRSYWNQDNSSAWYLFFSPDFYGNNNLTGGDNRVVEGNAYSYKFAVSDLVNKGSPNDVLLKNSANELVTQYTDPAQVEFLKSSPIIVGTIEFEGKGAPLVTITKEASPLRIVTGKTSTVTVTVSNNLQGNITDIEISDAALPAGLDGQPVSGKVEGPIPSGESYSARYIVSASRVGTYTLGKATVTFADPTGNYQRIESGEITIVVI